MTRAVTRDSAGITIVENSAPSHDSIWQLSEQPVVTIGAADDDSTQALFRVEGAVRLSDGRIVVANGPPPMLRWFDSAGVFLHGTGRGGGGPGEFPGREGAWIYALWPLAADSIAAWHHSSRSMLVFSPQGRYTRTMSVPAPPDVPAGAWPQALGIYDHGIVAYVTTPSRNESAPVGTVTRDTMPFIRYNHDGSYAGRLGRFPGFTSFIGEIQTRVGTRTTQLRPPFARAFYAWVHGDRFYYGAGHRYEISIYDTTGMPRRVIRRSGEPRAVTADIIDAYKNDRRKAVANDPARLPELERTLASMPFPDSMPAYRRLRTDRDGLLWVQEYDLASDSVITWNVFDHDGKWQANVRLPKGLTVYDIGRDYVLGLVTDEMDVEQIVLYRLYRR